MNRKITRQEKDWLLKGLGTLESGKYFGGGRWIDTKAGKTKPLDKPVDPKFWLNQIDHLRVIDQCDCGEPNCHTVKFQNFESGKSVALVGDSPDDGRMLIIHINEDNGLIAELEMISEKYPVMPNIYLQGTAGAMPPLTRFGRIRSCTSGEFASKHGHSSSDERPSVMTIRVVEDNQAEAGATLDPTEVSVRKVEFDYLRAFVVVLVLCHHAVLSYTISASINFENPIATSTPVVNEQRWIGFDLIVAFNETFIMPLLFFISGMFVWQSLARKGTRKYLGGRLTRLGLPFVAGVGFLIPLAYYPAQLQVGLITGVDSSYGAFWLEMVRSGFGTAGPLWFLWLLLAFDCLATLLYRVAPFPGGLIRKRSIIILGSPVTFFGALLCISIAAYPPMAIIFGPLQWIGIGPFSAQIGRILLYLVYFLAGTAIGACGIDRSAFRSDGALAKRWWGWLVVGLMSFIVFIIMVVVVTANDRTIVSEIAFVLCCGATVFGMTGLFLRFAKRRVGIFDSLSENSYGIYVVHYVFVTWLQYLFLGSPLAPSVKGMVVFLGTLILSWGTVAAIRCIPAVARVI